MLFNVPQFIDVEDKVAGPLTAKQIFWMLGMGGVLFIVWTLLDASLFFVLAIPVIIIFVLFAFYRPYNQSLISFSMSAMMFLFRPKLYTWDRPGILKESPVNRKEENVAPEVPERLSVGIIRELAQTVDRDKRR